MSIVCQNKAAPRRSICTVNTLAYRTDKHRVCSHILGTSRCFDAGLVLNKQTETNTGAFILPSSSLLSSSLSSLLTGGGAHKGGVQCALLIRRSSGGGGGGWRLQIQVGNVKKAVERRPEWREVGVGISRHNVLRGRPITV